MSDSHFFDKQRIRRAYDAAVYDVAQQRIREREERRLNRGEDPAKIDADKQEHRLWRERRRGDPEFRARERERKEKWRAENRDYVLATGRERERRKRIEQNRVKRRRERQRKWDREHPENVAARRQRYIERHPERIRKRNRDYYAANKETINARQIAKRRELRETDPEFREKERQRLAQYRAANTERAKQRRQDPEKYARQLEANRESKRVKAILKRLGLPPERRVHRVGKYERRENEEAAAAFFNRARSKRELRALPDELRPNFQQEVEWIRRASIDRSITEQARRVTLAELVDGHLADTESWIRPQVELDSRARQAKGQAPHDVDAEVRRRATADYVKTVTPAVAVQLDPRTVAEVVQHDAWWRARTPADVKRIYERSRAQAPTDPAHRQLHRAMTEQLRHRAPRKEAATPNRYERSQQRPRATALAPQQRRPQPPGLER